MVLDVAISLTASLAAFLVYFVPMHGAVELTPRYVLLGMFCGVVFVHIGRMNGWYQFKRIVGPTDTPPFLAAAWSFAVLGTATVIFCSRWTTSSRAVG